MTAKRGEFPSRIRRYDIAAVLLLLLAAAGGCFVGGSREKRAKKGAEPAQQAAPCAAKGEVAAALLARMPGLRARFLSGTPVSGGALRIHAEVEPPHLQPLLRPDAWIMRMVLGNVFEPLVARDPVTYEMKGALAESWEHDAAAGTWTFHLAQGARWHDGAPFTSKDVVFTFDLLMNPATDARTQRSSLEQVDSWKAPDDSTVVLHVRAPSFLFLQNLEALPILPAHVYSVEDINSHPANRAPVGTGPFRFKEWTAGKQIALARNEGYRGKKAWLDEVRFCIHRDRSVAYQLLRKGEIDLMPRVGADQLIEAGGDADVMKRFERLAFDTPDFSFLMFNAGSPLFSDTRVRQAFAMLLDVEKIRSSVYRCLARAVTGPFPAGHPAADPAVAPWPYDPKRAGELLAQAGWKDADGDGLREKGGKELRFTFIVPSQSKEVQRVATIYQEDLRAAGARMDVSLQDWAIYVDLCRAHSFDMAAMMWDMEWDNDLHGLFHSSAIDGGQNFPAWHNDEADRILQESRTMLDDAARNALLRRLHAILREEVPYVFGFSPMELSLASRSLRGDGMVAGIKWFHPERIWIDPSAGGT